MNAEQVTQADPVASIDEDKYQTKWNWHDFFRLWTEGAKLQQLKNEEERLNAKQNELDAKRNRAKSALDKQYSRLLDDPETDLVTFKRNIKKLGQR